MLSHYLFFNAQCEAALDLYERAFNSKNTGVMKFKDAPASDPFEGVDLDLVMHTELPVGDSTLYMCDDPTGEVVVGDNVVINFSHSNFEEVRRVWQVFVDHGSQVTMNLEPTFFSPLFGQLRDPYGVSWMIMVSSEI